MGKDNPQLLIDLLAEIKYLRTQIAEKNEMIKKLLKERIENLEKDKKQLVIIDKIIELSKGGT